MPEAGLEPARSHASWDFKSVAGTDHNEPSTNER